MQCRNSGHSTDAYGAALLHQLERELHGNSSYSSRAFVPILKTCSLCYYWSLEYALRKLALDLNC